MYAYVTVCVDAGGDSDDDDSMEGLNPLELASPTSSEDGHVNNLDSDDLDDDDVDSEAEGAYFLPVEVPTLCSWPD